MSLPKKIDKPWGYELLWAKTDKYVGKILHIKAGHKLSLQFHKIKDETIFLYRGSMELEIEEDGRVVKKKMAQGDSFRIAPGIKHRMIAIDDCEIVEVSTPHLDDVVRIEDDYGRVKKELK